MSSKATVRFTAQYWLRLVGFLLIAMSVALTALLIFLVNKQVNAFITPHRIRNLGPPQVVGEVYTDVNLTTSDGLNIAGWYFPGYRGGTPFPFPTDLSVRPSALWNRRYSW